MNKDFDKTFSDKGECNKSADQAYAYYSRVLNEPFETVDALKAAEEAHFTKLKAKEDRAAAKKRDAQAVENAFKALNAARRFIRPDLISLTEDYSKNLQELKNAFEEDKTEIRNTLAEAEAEYANALKSFTEKYPEGYHLTLKDSDFETTISRNTSTTNNEYTSIASLFDAFFGF